MKTRLGVIAASLLAVVGCGLDYEPLTFSVEGGAIFAEGVIDGSSLEAFQATRADHPEITTLVLRTIEGSADDAANLAFSRQVRALGFVTVVPSDGMVASGGTDLFLAGATRVLEPGACMGVHSWSAGEYTATDLPRSDPEHAPYLTYYRDIGIDEDFYWFTLEAAPAESMHWMTRQEVDTYGITSGPAPRMGDAAACDTR